MYSVTDALMHWSTTQVGEYNISLWCEWLLFYCGDTVQYLLSPGCLVLRYTHARAHAFMHILHTRTHAYTHIHTACTHTSAHSRTYHTHVHMHVHTYTHSMYTYTHIYIKHMTQVYVGERKVVYITIHEYTYISSTASVTRCERKFTYTFTYSNKGKLWTISLNFWLT